MRKILEVLSPYLEDAIKMVVILFAVVAVLSDGTFAIIAGKARQWFATSPQRLETMSAVGGAMMIVLAVTLVLT